jgi:hypothetical protein
VTILQNMGIPVEKIGDSTGTVDRHRRGMRSIGIALRSSSPRHRRVVVSAEESVLHTEEKFVENKLSATGTSPP